MEMSSDKSTIMCKYWAVGSCRYGERCPYAHSLQATSSNSSADLGEICSDKSAIMCKYWAVGRCIKGQQCPYAHSWQASSNTCSSKPKKKMRSVTWYAPLPDWIKINTDGAARGNSGESSCAAVFRDSTGDVRGAFCCFLGIGISALEAEMQAVIRAIDIATSSGLRKIWVETDSGELVNLLNDRATDVADFMRDSWCDLVKQIDNLEDVLISHIYREGNTVADKLANYGIESRANIVWDEAPDFILPQLLLDASHHAYHRS